MTLRLIKEEEATGRGGIIKDLLFEGDDISKVTLADKLLFEADTKAGVEKFIGNEVGTAPLSAQLRQRLE